MTGSVSYVERLHFSVLQMVDANITNQHYQKLSTPQGLDKIIRTPDKTTYCNRQTNIDVVELYSTVL